MGAINKTTAGVSAPTVVTHKSRANGLAIIIVDLPAVGQCDCDHGIRYTRFGKPYPCPDCADGDHMADCQRASDYEDYLDRLDRSTGAIQ